MLRRPVAAFLGVLVLGVSIYLVFFHKPAPTPVESAPHLPFGSEQQAYAPKVQIANLRMSTAENFLNQEVKILSGDAINSGDRSLAGLEVTITYEDDMHQIVLREVRPLFLPSGPPLEPGKTAHFDISFDHIPNSWNVQMPAVRVSGLEFARVK